MNISINELSNPSICEFALAYEEALQIFETEPVSAEPKLKKKICKWMQKDYISRENLEELYVNSGKKISDTDFLELAKQCLDKIRKLEEQEEAEFEKNTTSLDEKTKSLLLSLIKHENECTQFMRKGNNLQLFISYTGNFCYVINLIDASDFPENQSDNIIHFKKLLFDTQTNQYRLTLKIENWDNDTEEICEITFSDAKTEILNHRAVTLFGVESPWVYLLKISDSILLKHTLGAQLNSQESVGIPLFAELAKINPFATVAEEFDNPEFPLLQKYLTQFNCEKPLKLLEKIKQNYYDPKCFGLRQKLLTLLSNKKYEPLWRELFLIVSNCQNEYPLLTELLYDRDKLDCIRSQIERFMHGNGYSGTYPDFVKHSEIRGFHCVSIKDTPYLIGAEKNVYHFIRFNELICAERPIIELACGTQMLKDGEQKGDIYSCMFNTNGRSLFYTTDINFNQSDFSEEELNDFINIAVKKTELQKLTKEEKQTIGIPSANPVLIIFLGLLVYGLPFGVLLTIGMILLTVFLTILDGNVVSLPDILSDLPWFHIFLGSTGIFGLCMGIFTAWAIKK